MLKSALEGDETPQAQVKQNLSAEPQAETFLEQSENESARRVTGLPESRPINSEGQGHRVPCTRQAPNLLCLPGLLRALLSPPLPQSWGSSVRALTGKKRSAGKQTELVTAGVHIHLFN